MCAQPFRPGGLVEYACGGCSPCHINRKRLWTSRLMLESHQHEVSSFVTLTYNEENVPSDGSLHAPDVTNFLKRLRWNLGLQRVRYFAVGEYGESTWRPHYHLALFGVMDQDLIESSWGRGNVHVGFLTPESASYMASYLNKGMTKGDDVRLKGRQPEFARMSRRPGIGAEAMAAIAKWLCTKTGARYLAETGDVPSVVRSNGVQWPLGRYLRQQIRKEIGMDEGAPKEVLVRQSYEKVLELERIGRDAYEHKRAHGANVAAQRVALTRSKRNV